MAAPLWAQWTAFAEGLVSTATAQMGTERGQELAGMLHGAVDPALGQAAIHHPSEQSDVFGPRD